MSNTLSNSGSRVTAAAGRKGLSGLVAVFAFLLSVGFAAALVLGAVPQ